LQDVMFVVWKRAGAFGGRSRPSTWIFGIAYRQAMHSLDRGRDAALDAALESADGELAEHGAEDRALGNRELRLSLEKALGRLSPEHRAVLELTFFEDCSYREIAEILGCPLNTVKTRMFHARQHLRRILPRLGWRVSRGARA
ncbi:MAG: sigma-70 family RNA polymerase sigma factor, partial [Holophagales bacterium]|nr:sigma-70 family RNA polymerase sigma factor [Holophagales bacterium]